MGDTVVGSASAVGVGGAVSSSNGVGGGVSTLDAVGTLVSKSTVVGELVILSDEPVGGTVALLEPPEVGEAETVRSVDPDTEGTVVGAGVVGDDVVGGTDGALTGVGALVSPLAPKVGDRDKVGSIVPGPAGATVTASTGGPVGATVSPTGKK